MVKYLNFSNAINPKYSIIFALDSYFSFKAINVKKMYFIFTYCCGLNMCVPPKFMASH